MKRATFISVILVYYTLFLSSLSAQQFPNSSFEEWAGGTPAYWEEWGDFEDCVVPTGGYLGFNAARLQEVEHPQGNSYYMGMQLTEPLPPITTEFTWFRFYYKTFQDTGSSVDMDLDFYDQSGNVVAHHDDEFYFAHNTNNWTLVEYDLNFSGTPSTGYLRFDSQAHGYNGWYSHFDIDELMLIDAANITEPQEGDKWIAGETDTIRWYTETTGLDIILQYSTDDGYSWENIVELPVDSGKYGWDIPEDLLSNEAAIRIVHEANNIYKVHDDVDIKIKPYIITKLDGTGHYVAYDINIDRWGFGNTEAEMWPYSYWFYNFNYQGFDPFTNEPYPNSGVFANAFRFEFPDWESWVNTFSIEACYWSTEYGIYSPTAVERWGSKKHVWGGSCYGIAISNALAFEYKANFRNKYPNFPSFVNPIDVVSNDDVRRVISELFTHGYTYSTWIHRKIGFITKTVNETLNDIREMLLEDETRIKTLSFWSNSTGGGHTVVPYNLKQSEFNKNIYYIYVWDNSYPNETTARIWIDTTGNGNNGTWNPVYGNYPGWGGNKWFMLDVLAGQYLEQAVLTKTGEHSSPFLLNDNELEINNTYYADITIVDSLGNITGYIDSLVYDDIPGSAPLIATTGSITPPYGYYLTTDNYSMVMNDFTEDTIDAFFFTGNKTFTYERYAATQTQTDRLFFDGGVSVANSDQETKPIKLLTIVNDTTNAEEKLFVMRSLGLAQNDSVKIEFVDNNNLKLISYGTAKDYEIGLEYASATQMQLFGNNSIQLSANTTHTFVPEWPNIYENQLTILVDVGNNGTIDDTLHIENQITDVEDDHGSMLIPDEYRLEQNYPNPFNNSTVIKYAIPQEGLVTLQIYNAIGEEVATLVNEIKQTGNYTATFDATNLTSGIYLYRLQSGEFIETKKMILLR
jgi:hypothetical protein